MVSFGLASVVLAASFFSQIKTSLAAPAPQAAASTVASAPAATTTTVGNSTDGSVLGTLNAPTYALFVNNDISWGSNTTSDINVYSGTPNSRQTRYYNWTVARSTIVVNGVSKEVVLVNGQFPGPTLEANYGDTFVIDVHNKIDNDGTALHWHGLLQVGTQSMDGIPGVGMCPIAPQKSRRYTFSADMYGSSWWHSHYSTQYSAGLFGPIIIHGPLQPGISYTADKGPVLLGDWSYKTYEQLAALSVAQNTNGRVFSDISLINGKTNATFSFKKGETYRLRLTNTAAEATYVFSIDEHDFTVFAHDFVPVQPYVTRNITLDVGQRADIIVKANGAANGSYVMRSTALDCSNILAPGNKAVATIYYQNASKVKPPASIPWNVSTACGVFPNTTVGVPVPVKGLSPPATPGAITTLNITTGPNITHHPLWYINNSSFRANYNQPPLLLAAAGNYSYPSRWNVYNQGSASSVRLIVYNYSPAAHPLHLHGHNFWVIAQGWGTWDGKRNVGNPSNPPRRDTFTILGQNFVTGAPGYVVLDYDQDNPGVWPFHCHIAWHVSGGLYAQMLERPKDIKKQDQTAYDTCAGYVDWQNRGNIVNQIDSGERRA